MQLFVIRTERTGWWKLSYTIFEYLKKTTHHADRTSLQYISPRYQYDLTDNFVLKDKID